MTNVSTLWLVANNTPSAALISSTLGVGVGVVTNATLFVGTRAWAMLANGAIAPLGDSGSGSIAWTASQADARASLTFSVRGLGDADVLGHLLGVNGTWGADPVLGKEPGTASMILHTRYMWACSIMLLAMQLAPPIAIPPLPHRPPSVRCAHTTKDCK
jgi:hypothetical protein